MSTIRILTSVNWVLISIYGAFVLWALLQKSNPYNDAGGGDMETAIKGLAVFLLLVFIGLNWLPYQWTKVMVLIFEILVLLLIRSFTTD
ncbi:MAG TPA: hypothetical protein VGA96_13085 [Fibrella sp.]